MFKPKIKNKKTPSKGENIETEINISIEDAFRGKEQSIGVRTVEGKLKKFHPLLVITEEFEEWFIKTRNIKLCELYYPPYNFERTGCKGCPYNMNLQSYLDTLAILLPEERKQCETIWKPVYDEYRRIGFRLNNQPTLFE